MTDMTAFPIPSGELPHRLGRHADHIAEHSGKWPGWVRVCFILGLSGALWGAIIFGFMALFS